MERTRVCGGMTFIALLAMLLVACGAPATTSSTAAPVQKVTAADNGGLTVKHARGEITLEQPATRIVACSEEAADFALTLGVQLVGFCSDRVEGAQNGMPLELAHFFDKKLLQSNRGMIVGIHRQFDSLDIQPVVGEVDGGTQQCRADAFALPIVAHGHPKLRYMTATRAIHRV